MVPTLHGSYEGLPPNLMDLVVRDRRWAQGNLQHLSIVGQGGITTMGRVHLAMGAMSYLVSAIWALSLAVGVVLTLQSQQMIPSYFEDSKTLFPIWPVIDPGAALRLFIATIMVVMLPKALGLALEIKRVRRARERGGVPRAFVGVFTETIFSMLVAPVLMCTQTVAVMQILGGFDSGWKAQRRDDGGIPFADAMRIPLAAYGRRCRARVAVLVFVAGRHRLDGAGDPGSAAGCAAELAHVAQCRAVDVENPVDPGGPELPRDSAADRPVRGGMDRADRRTCAPRSHQRHRRSAGAAAPFSGLAARRVNSAMTRV